MKRRYLSMMGLGAAFLLPGCLAQNTAALQNTSSTSSSTPLSANAAAVFEKVQSLEKAVKDARETLCPRDSTLQEKVKDELDAIHDVTSLSDEEKKAAAQTVHEKYRTELEADKSKVEACAKLHADDWNFLKETDRTVHKACVPPPPAKGKGNGRGDGRGDKKSERKSDGQPHQQDNSSQTEENQPPPPGEGPRPPKPNFGNMSEQEIAAWEALLTSDGCAAAIDKATLDLKI